MIMANAAAWQAALDGASDARARPELGKRSPLEYARHVRDVFRVLYERPGRTSQAGFSPRSGRPCAGSTLTRLCAAMTR